VLAKLALGDGIEDILAGYPWLERDDILACLEYARRSVSGEYFVPAMSNGDPQP
jgi:uncharacterized protein (DUF433 family)